MVQPKIKKIKNSETNIRAQSVYPSTYLFDYPPIRPTWNFQICFQPLCHCQICLLLFDMENFSSIISDSCVFETYKPNTLAMTFKGLLKIGKLLKQSSCFQYRGILIYKVYTFWTPEDYRIWNIWQFRHKLSKNKMAC